MSSSRIVLEAIARRRCLHAVYNRAPVRLAPHILYTRHDELYVDAVTLERDGRPPRETKLGTFKLSGLHEPAVVDSEAFRLEPAFDPADPRYEGVTLLAAEMG
ncbi:MAG: hypothetical protein JO276_01425 [Sphingomonadaceae bacterium]|nr:hypothetical protein [Sphingomonadaceae bacterium]